MEIIFQLSGTLPNKEQELWYGERKALRFEGSRWEEFREIACSLFGSGILRFMRCRRLCELEDEGDFVSFCDEYKRSKLPVMEILVFCSDGNPPISNIPVKSPQTPSVTTPNAVDCSGNTSRKRPHSTSVVRKLNEGNVFGSARSPCQMAIDLGQLLSSDKKFDENWYLPKEENMDTSPIVGDLQHNEQNTENSHPVTEFQYDPLDLKSFSHRPLSIGEILDEQERVRSISPSTSQPGRLPEVPFPQAYLPLLEYSDEVKDVDDEALSVFREKNPQNFQRYFWTYGPLIHAYESHLRRVVIIDCDLFLNTSGILMTALSVDPDNRTFPLAFAVAAQENESNWTFFFKQLSKHVLKSTEPLVIQTCRHTLMTKLITQYLRNALHVYCPFHLFEMISRTSPEAAEKFKEASTELDEGRFSRRMVELRGFSEATHENLVAIGYEKWADLYISKAGFSRFSTNTVNHLGSWHAMILDFSNQPLPMYVQCVRTTIARHFQLYRALAARRPQHLCPTADWMIQQQTEQSRGCRARAMVGGKFMVQSDHPGAPHTVDLTRRHCTCNFWQVHSIPCSHAIACLGSSGLESAKHLVSNCYSTRTLQQMYEESWVPTSSAKSVPIGLCCTHCYRAGCFPNDHGYIPSWFEQSKDEN